MAEDEGGEREEERREGLTKTQQFIIELIMMIIVGVLVLLPFSLYVYHFLI
ncbi:MAG: hypothetical protein BAJALOKI1v1_300010 [Promethearchaeota archaeon]|nr:MAG: hypothetical protein BAJALOKI1v1_300010 [Candidatus Lokiarchaeota archaeon]